MKPQPPVTSMRIAALSSSVAEAAPIVSPAPSDAWENLKRRAAATDWTPWLIVALGAFLRFFLLGIKPPHFDEGINGWFVDQMVKNGFYRYDPTNYHGPFHFYVLFVCQTLFGRNVWAIRLPVVLASIFSVHLTMKFEPFVGRTVSRLAALAMAVSPGFVFYGRYSIHEVWLLAFSMLFILGLLGLWQRGTVDYLWCAGMGLAGMILTKETYIIHLGCAFIAIFVTAVSHKITPLADAKPARQTWTYFDFVMMSVTGLAVIIFFYSGGFLNWPGVTGLWKTFEAWFKTGSQGAGHEKETYYWLELITRYEQPMGLGLIACVACQYLRHVGLRYLAIYGVGTLLAYSIVKYKTPWCIISIAWPLLFMFGAVLHLKPFKYSRVLTVAGAWLLSAFLILRVARYLTKAEWSMWHALSVPLLICAIILSVNLIIALRRPIMAALLAISLGLTVSLNYFRCSTFNEFNWNWERGIFANVTDFYAWEPYVYVQTYNDVWKLTKPLLRLAKSNPTYYQMIGHLIRTSTYPLPWMLGDFTKVGYYEHNNMPEKLDGDFLLVQEDKIQEVESKLHETYYTELMTIRPYQDYSKLYFNARVFNKLFPNRTPEFTGTPAH
ncbi:MAG: hypothetical protein QOD64_1185 [Verrucomicrobiota bacterium]